MSSITSPNGTGGSSGGGGSSSGSSGGGDNEILYIVAGAAAFGFVAALVALTLLAFRRIRSGPTNSVTPIIPEDKLLASSGGGNGNNNSNNNNGGGTQTTGTIGISSEILVSPDKEEVSTLGDPVLQQTGAMMNLGAEGGVTVPQADEQTASIGNDYDWTKQYMRAQGIASLSDSCGDRGSSDNSIEVYGASISSRLAEMGGASGSEKIVVETSSHRFEVDVPPGKLGMVIDTPDGGVPMVHAIKDDSVLAAHVKVGDRLVLVDGDDVTIMTALQVSQLISLKSDQHRLLVFVRGIDLETGGASSSVFT